MNVFVFEHVCGGGMLREAIAPQLAAQGGAMLEAVVADFVRAEVDVSTTLDHRLPRPLRGAKVTVLERADQVARSFDRLASASDVALVIAPETDGILHEWSARLAQLPTRNLGCSAPAIARCADKLMLAKHLQAEGIATPPTVLLSGASHRFPAVVKPRYGAGCEETFVVNHADDLGRLGPRRDWIVQPMIAGNSVSVSLLICDSAVMPLPAGEQKISMHGSRPARLRYDGGSLPLSAQMAEPAGALAKRAASSVPGLNGFVGVDLVLNAAGAAVIEINPRITMSYLALRSLCTANLAAAMLDDQVAPDWINKMVHFDAAGKVEVQGAGDPHDAKMFV